MDTHTANKLTSRRRRSKRKPRDADDVEVALREPAALTIASGLCASPAHERFGDQTLLPWWVAISDESQYFGLSLGCPCRGTGAHRRAVVGRLSFR